MSDRERLATEPFPIDWRAVPAIIRATIRGGRIDGTGDFMMSRILACAALVAPAAAFAQAAPVAPVVPAAPVPAVATAGQAVLRTGTPVPLKLAEELT